jgi:hypothetical protein
MLWMPTQQTAIRSRKYALQASRTNAAAIAAEIVHLKRRSQTQHAELEHVDATIQLSDPWMSQPWQAHLQARSLIPSARVGETVACGTARNRGRHVWTRCLRWTPATLARLHIFTPMVRARALAIDTATADLSAAGRVWSRLVVNTHHCRRIEVLLRKKTVIGAESLRL